MKSLGFVLAWLAAIPVVVMMVFGGLIAPLTGVLSLAALVLAFFWWLSEVRARRRWRARVTPRHLLIESNWEAQKRARGLPSIFDTRDPMGPHWRERRPPPDSFDRKRWTLEELMRGADIDAILAEDDAHNRLGL